MRLPRLFSGSPSLVFYMEQHQSWYKSGELYAAYSKTDPAIVAGTPRVRFSQDVRPALIQPVIDVAAKYNGFTTFPAQDIIYAPAR